MTAHDMSTSGLMAGKKGLIMGVANDKSIAWGIAEALATAGAELAFTYQTEAFSRLCWVASAVGWAMLDPNSSLQLSWLGNCPWKLLLRPLLNKIID